MNVTGVNWKEEVNVDLLQLGWHHGNNSSRPLYKIMDHTRDEGFFNVKKYFYLDEFYLGGLRMSIQIPRGTQDILPGEVEKWQLIEQ